MELQLVEGGPSVKANDWTIFPIGWPGPEPSYGVVKSVGPRTAIVHDIFFGMDVEFKLDLIDVVTAARKANMTPAESSSFEKATRLLSTGWEQRLAA